MTSRTLSSALTTTAVMLVAVSVARWRGSPTAIAAPVSFTDAKYVIRRQPLSPDSLAATVELIVSNDPFRLSNRPPTVRFDAGSDAPPGAAPSAPGPRPLLVLKAIVGGPPWQAVIDGIPGRPPGTMAEEGQRFDKLVVRLVTRDSVVVQGPDTAWVLGFMKRS